ncbi:hypothetical protein GYMLUDRAFT_59372 [Collybiopsis luxurians FD-317 M1]|uniref:Unplaced genomic scaffold GYMLUscaffold_26, whole genome shotgun sequence n=1 Tax=Collybiopsis luxurians FD-317 M1 TaxID=944289 RepID=A0A0D0BA92_9AGAR|nr:hypothetical protein GYMLUDRAFT_59372 [Collybiopsis luxurians FD-317 M1]
MLLQRPLNLVGVDAVLQDLRDADVRGISVEELTNDKTISWIWKNAGIDPRNQDSINGALRIAWCKSRARVRRWQEEGLFVQEEMRRTLCFFDVQASEWANRAEKAKAIRGPDDSEEFAQGRVAYAMRQASIRRKIRDYAEARWVNSLAHLKAGVGAISLDDTNWGFA